jgi:putative transposase
MGRKRNMSAAASQENLVNAAPTELKSLSTLGLLRFGGELLLKKAVEEEITRYLGRGFYEHLKGDQESTGYRNGTRETTIDTPIGQVTYDRPLLTGAPDFQSQYHTPYMRRPEEFAQAVGDMHVNGVSSRNVKRALKAVTGTKVRLSKSAVSRVTKRIRLEFGEWKKRKLKDVPAVYLFLDAIRVKMRVGSKALDSVMIAYAVLEDGSFETLAIATRNSESDAAWGSFIYDLKRRGLRDPLLVVSDGNHGVIEAIESHFPTAWRQRCVRHKVENVLECVPTDDEKNVREELDKIFYGATSLEQAKLAVNEFKRRYRNVYPSAIECLERDLAQCLSFYMFPQSHWRRIRTSNRLERMNLEIRRRLKTIGRHPFEEGCLALVYRICTRHAEGKKGFLADDLVRALWSRLRDKKIEMITQLELGLELQAA